jgi:hypothetical protein
VIRDSSDVVRVEFVVLPMLVIRNEPVLSNEMAEILRVEAKAARKLRCSDQVIHYLPP